MRRLEVTVAGYWYTALTIGLGVVALVSGNNVLYLIESLLLSGMIFSGILSERSISALEIEVRRQSAIAGVPARDQVTLRNMRRFPVFCVEVGEWKDKKFLSSIFVPRVAPRGELSAALKTVFKNRGVQRWDGIAIATSYPFGLARKVRVIRSPGERIVWPERASLRASRDDGGEQTGGSRAGQDFAEGEVRPYTSDDDCRNIVWTLSMRGGDPYVRVRKSDREEPRILLDLRGQPGPEFEKRVKAAAQPFYRQEEGSSSGTLVLLDERGKRTFRGKVPSLNQLALAQARESDVKEKSG